MPPMNTATNHLLIHCEFKISLRLKEIIISVGDCVVVTIKASQQLIGL